MITVNTTINVPADYATIIDALNSIKDEVIASDVIVTIKVADGTYNINGTVELNHKYGDRIELIGNINLWDDCVLNFTEGGLKVSYNHVFKKIEGFKIMSTEWQGSGLWSKTGFSGISAIRGGIIREVTNTFITRCYYGLRAADGGQIYCGEKVRVTGAGDGGVFAFGSGSIIHFKDGFSGWNKDATNNLGYGIIAENNAWVWCDGSSFSDNYKSGVYANTGGAIWMSWGSSDYNGEHGVKCMRGSKVEIKNCNLDNNHQAGLYCGKYSYALTTGTGGTGNPDGVTTGGEFGLID